MTENLYEILEVDMSASFSDIKRSFRKLSMKYHPDKNKNNSEYITKFQRISNAYSILSEVESRSKYDSFHYSTRKKCDVHHTTHIDSRTDTGIVNYKNDVRVSTTHVPTCIVENLDITIHQSYTGCKLPICVRRIYSENATH